jgi:hypothetical protein
VAQTRTASLPYGAECSISFQLPEPHADAPNGASWNGVHVNDLTWFCHVVIAIPFCRQNVRNRGRIIRIMQIALPQKAIIAKRNDEPALRMLKSLILLGFFRNHVWHADCIISTDN